MELKRHALASLRPDRSVGEVFGAGHEHQQPTSALRGSWCLQDGLLRFDLRGKVKPSRCVLDGAPDRVRLGLDLEVDLAIFEEGGVLEQVGNPLVDHQPEHGHAVRPDHAGQRSVRVPLVEQLVELVDGVVEVVEGRRRHRSVEGRRGREERLRGAARALRDLLLGRRRGRDVGLEGGLDGRELAEHLVGARQLHDNLHGSADGREHHLAAGRRKLAVQREDDAQAGRVEDAGACEVQNEVADALTGVLLAGRLEVGGVAEVERLADADDGGRGGGLLERKAHG